MIEALLAQLASSPWALSILFVLVLGDAFLVLIPGEAAVVAMGALASATGVPPLGAVIAVAAAAAFLGDVACYLIGRLTGLDRWRWMRGPRMQAAFGWARARLDQRIGAVLFTARFVPFARLAVNLTAGASRLALGRYLAVAAGAALAWAAYQSLAGAVISMIVPGGTLVSVLTSIVVALALGFAVDAVLSRRRS